jgi:NADH-quinone oxidoreductase subunit A
MIHLWPLIVYGAAALALVAGMLLLSAVLGQRHREGATDQPYESGIVSTGTVCMRFDVKFYLMAMFFVIFDLEAVFVFAYAVAFRASGWMGYIEFLSFVVILMAALIYLWRLGVLDWGTRRHRMIHR